MIVERFAPSPTGPLHLGHAFSAHLAWSCARAKNGTFLLRLEDLDQGRCRSAYVKGIFQDLGWLGLDWPQPVLRQSERGQAYAQALARLDGLGLVYRCTCTRRDVQTALSAPQEGVPVQGPDGLVYPGTCRGTFETPPDTHALRLDIDRAIHHLGGAEAIGVLTYTEIGGDAGPTLHALNAAELRNGTGDIVLARRDGAIAYHLAVVVDDAHQGVTHVTRGEDLAPATPVHRLLQVLLDLPTPVYRHHPLVRDDRGKRLAKRDDARAISTYRHEGRTPEEVIALAVQASRRA